MGALVCEAGVEVGQAETFDGEGLVASGGAMGDGDGALGHAETLGEQGDEGIVGGAVDGRDSEPRAQNAGLEGKGIAARSGRHPHRHEKPTALDAHLPDANRMRIPRTR